MKTTLILGFICCIGLLACSDKKRGEFVIAGKILNVADSTPYASREVTMLYQWEKAGIPGRLEIRTAGGGNTDALGNFEILADWYRPGGIYFLDNKDYGKIINSKAKGERIEIGTVYK